jgi:hypothetical protein
MATAASREIVAVLDDADQILQLGESHVTVKKNRQENGQIASNIFYAAALLITTKLELKCRLKVFINSPTSIRTILNIPLEGNDGLVNALMDIQTHIQQTVEDAVGNMEGWLPFAKVNKAFGNLEVKTKIGVSEEGWGNVRYVDGKKKSMSRMKIDEIKKLDGVCAMLRFIVKVGYGYQGRDGKVGMIPSLIELDITNRVAGDAGNTNNNTDSIKRVREHFFRK